MGGGGGWNMHICGFVFLCFEAEAYVVLYSNAGSLPLLLHTCVRMVPFLR